VPVVDRWSAGKAPDAWPFDAPEGGPLRESNWKRSVGWSAATAAAGIPGFRVHDLRHTAASVWLGAGADPKVIQRALGHASAAMTMDLHGHLMDGNLWQAARVVGGISGHLSCLSSTTRAPMNWRRTEMPGERGFLPERSSSLKERAGVKGGFGLQFCGGMAFAGHGGMALWLAFPDRCRVRASGLAGQGPGGARPRSGAAGVLDALDREPMMAGAGKGRGRVHGLCGYGRPIAGCPAGRPAGCLHPFGCAPAWRAGGHGAGSRPGAGGTNHISVPAAGPAGAGCGGEHKTSRSRARPGRQLTLPGWWRGGCARRACRRTPGSA
jgi:hypothetical protein